MDSRNQKALEALMGALVLIVFSMFLILAYFQSNKSLRQGYLLTARFDRVDGLLLGNDVRVNGVKVGEVRDMALDPTNYLVIVTFDVQSSLKLPEDSVAQITSDGFLGGKALSIVPGDSHSFLKSQSEITQTQSSVSLEALLSQFIFNAGGGSKS